MRGNHVLGLGLSLFMLFASGTYALADMQQKLTTEDGLKLRAHFDSGLAVHDAAYGGVSEVGVAVPIAGMWFADIFSRGGISCRDVNIDTCAGIVAVGAGLGRRFPLKRGAFEAIARFKHVHIASLESWGKQPIDNILASPESEIVHRSGIELVARYLMGQSDDGARVHPYLVGRTGYLGYGSSYNWNATLAAGIQIEI